MLLSKLERAKIDGKILGLLKSYLDDRRSFIDGLECNPLQIGVPQGSGLGPLLFLIFINDLCQDLPSDLNVFLFADDITMWTSQSTWDAVEKVLSHGFSHISKKAAESLMEFRQEKCAVMAIGNDKRSLNVQGKSLQIIIGE